MRGRAMDRWLELSGTDVVLAVGGSGVVLRQAWSLGESAGTLLQTLSGLATATAGFGTLTASLLVSVTPGPRLSSALASVGHRTVRLIMASLIAMVAGAVAFAAAIGMPDDSGYPAAVVAGASLMTSFAVIRSGYLLALLLRALLPVTPSAGSPDRGTIVVDEPAPKGYEVRARMKG